MKSTSGTHAMGLRGLQVKTLCRILEACNANNVDELEVDGLKIKFARAQENKHATDAAVHTSNTTRPTEIEPPVLLTALDQQETEDDERLHLLLNDPLAHEQMMINDHLSRPEQAANGGVRDS